MVHRLKDILVHGMDIQPTRLARAVSLSENVAKSTLSVVMSTSIIMAKYSRSTLGRISTMLASHAAHAVATSAMIPTLSLPVTVTTAFMKPPAFRYGGTTHANKYYTTNLPGMQ